MNTHTETPQKWFTVTAYYPLTQISSGIYAHDTAHAEEIALELFAELWGDNARNPEHIESEEQ